MFRRFFRRNRSLNDAKADVNYGSEGGKETHEMDVNTRIGAPLTFRYFNLPPGFSGRGGVVSSFMIANGIQFKEAPRENFPPSEQVKKELINTNMSKIGALPVLTVGERHLAGHLAIMRYLEAKAGISGKDLYEDYVLDELADEYTTWRDSWATTLGGDAGNVEKYKAKREGFYDLMELFYETKPNKNSPYMAGGPLPRYADMAVYGMMSDDQLTNGDMDLKKYPSLQALWRSVRSLPNAKEFI